MHVFENTCNSVLLFLIFLLRNNPSQITFAQKDLRLESPAPLTPELLTFMLLFLCFSLSLKSYRPIFFFLTPPWNHFVFCSRTEAIDEYISVRCIWKIRMEESGQEKHNLKNTENPRIFLSSLICFCKQLARTLVRSDEKLTEVQGVSSVVDTWQLGEMQESYAILIENDSTKLKMNSFTKQGNIIATSPTVIPIGQAFPLVLTC